MDLTNLLLFPYSLAKQRHVKTIFLLLSHLLVGSRSMYTSNKSHPTEQKKAVSLKSIFMTRKDSEKMLYMVYWLYIRTEPSYQPQSCSAAFRENPNNNGSAFQLEMYYYFFVTYVVPFQAVMADITERK